MRRPPGASRTRGEQAARELHQRRGRLLAKRKQLVAQRDIVEAHPRGEPRADAVGHFRCAGLGESQAQDRFGTDAGEQQTQHPRRQHLGFAGAR